MTAQFAIPAVGSKVRVTVLMEDPSLFAKTRVKELVFDGTVLKSESWVRPTSFCMTGNKDHKVREIAIDMVGNIEYADGQTAAKVEVDSDVKIKQVPGSKPGSFYTVTKVGNKVSCTCVGFQFRKRCKHTEMI